MYSGIVVWSPKGYAQKSARKAKNAERLQPKRPKVCKKGMHVIIRAKNVDSIFICIMHVRLCPKVSGARPISQKNGEMVVNNNYVLIMHYMYTYLLVTCYY